MAQDAPAIDSMKKYTPLFHLLLLLLLVAMLPVTAFASVGLTAFFTQAGNESITVIWETESETQNSGYNVYRTEENVSNFQMIVEKVRVNSRPIAPIGELGGRYEVVDDTAVANTTYYYWLVDTDTQGGETYHGPALGRIERGTVIDPVGGTLTPTTTAGNGVTPSATTAGQPTTASSPEATATARPSLTATTAAQAATATASETATTAADGRVFITPSPAANLNPTATPTAVPTTTAGASETIAQPTQQIAVQTATPTTSAAVTVNDGVAASTDGVAEPTAAPVETDAPASIGDVANSSGIDQPTGDVALIDPETNSEVAVIEGVAELPAATAQSGSAGNFVQGNVNELGGAVTDVQQSNIVQPQSDESNLFLWFGVIAGGLLILVSAGFALLYTGNRNR
jgi:hypothetical protein